MFLPNGKFRVNLTAIARNLNLSLMTIYRVINNDVKVKDATRIRVIEALNKYGYFTHKAMPEVNVLFDFTNHQYLSYYGHELQKNIEALDYNCFSTDHRQHPTAFFDAVGNCDVAIFFSIPDQQVIKKAHAINPHLYSITLSTKSCANVTISPNNTMGGELAAQHLYKFEHQHIAVHLSENHPTRMERYKAFFAELKLLNPDCQIDMILQKIKDNTVESLNSYFASDKSKSCSAILFLAGAFAETYYVEFLQKNPQKYNHISVLTFDNPADQQYANWSYPFDRIECDSNELLEWAEYYITNRPMMKKRSQITTHIDVKLVPFGTVKIKE